MPQTTVAAIITRLEGKTSKILLTRRAIPPFQGQWCLPGGHIDPYETARQAIIREVKEETGLDFDARFLGYHDEIIPSHGIHAVVIVFEGSATGDVMPAIGEVTEIVWFHTDKASAFPLAFMHNDILDLHIRQRNAADHSKE